MIRGRMTTIRVLAIAALALVTAELRGEYPTISRLDRSDPLYLQHQIDVAEYYRLTGSGSEPPPLLIYRYEPREDDTLFAIAARLLLPYSAIASLNRLSGPSIDYRSSLLIPGVPGIFVPAAPRSDLEAIMDDLRVDRQGSQLVILTPEGQVRYRFFPGEDFLPEERTAFLGLAFRHPLPTGELSSPYGPRINPITARYSFHGGADYAAPAGTPVLAARGGIVSETGTDEILGHYVIVDHSGGFQTVYGHLQRIAVSLNEPVRSGMILGTVGSTGMVTGAHLHFEIRQNGRTRDPETMLR